MKLQRALLALACGALLVTKASAVTLSWSGGSTNVSFTTATRCTLIATVEAPDTTLPADLRLSWVARNCPELKLVAEAMPDPDGLQARVDELVVPSPLEATTQYRSAFVRTPAAAYASARFVIDLPVTARGNIRAVYSLPAGGAGTSNVVTFNLGIGATFAPVVLGSRTTVENGVVVIRASGVGLRTTLAARLSTADTSWTEPVGLTQLDDTSLSARNRDLVSLPQACLQLSSSDADMSAIVTSEAVSPQGPAAFSGSVLLTDPDPSIQLKDFAMVYDVERNPSTSKWEGLYHVYYIRQTSNGLGRVLAHQWSPDLVTWTGPDVTEFVAGAGGGTWDQAEVWAPTLIRRGNLWYMFYTGVDGSGNQSIGYATRASLRPGTAGWTRRSLPSVVQAQVPWMAPSVPTFPAQLRDPFVLDDPDFPGKALMLFVARNGPGLPTGNSVGVLRDDGALSSWTSVGPYTDTDVAHGFDAQDESPHAFRDPNVASHWRLMWTAAFSAPQNSVHFLHNAPPTKLSDVAVGSWRSEDGTPRLYQYTSGSVGFGWAGTEFLHTGNYFQQVVGDAPRGYTDLLAGYLTTGGISGIQISKLNWGAVNLAFPSHQDFTLDLSLTQVGGHGVGLGAAPKLRVAHSIVRRAGMFAVVDMPKAGLVEVDLIDVTGRRVRKLWNGHLPVGSTAIDWDLRDESGAPVRPGVMFVRLQSDSHYDVGRLIVLR